jgi:AcrR family transcriptional regulator
MGRRSRFTDFEIFAAVSAQIAQGDEVRIHDLAADTGVSVGSLYHRYGSREGIMAAAWLSSVQAFQSEFLAALQSDSPDAGENAALATPRFCRSHRDQAVILCVGRRETLLNDKAPPEIRHKVDALNADARSGLAAFANRQSLDMQACLHAIVAFPLASVRLYLPGKKVPKSVDDYIKAAYHSAIAIGAKPEA